MNANEYINGMADLLRTANAETLKALNAGLKALRATGEIKSASQGYAPLVLERAIEYRMDFGF